jgi:predicted RNase H-like HicB family nuclease
MNKPDKYSYPAFIGFDEPAGRYYILFPDLPGCTTTGDTEKDALLNAQEAMSLHLFGMEDEGDAVPSPSSIMELKGGKGETVVLIEAWMPHFREQMETKAVNKTVTLPGWLDKLARTANLNYSQILRDAIIDRLGVSRTIMREKNQERKEKVPA